MHRCYALEKIDGTSAHISWNNGQLGFFAGCASHSEFIKLFDLTKLEQFLKDTGREKITIYGEAYGGKIQGMSETYGKQLRFVAFDVLFDDDFWLNVPQAERFVLNAGLEFVDYVEITTEIDQIEAQKLRDSSQAIRNGMGLGKMREGIVLRPLEEMKTSQGCRIIAKHRRDEFRETKTPRPLDANKIELLKEAQAIASEWVTVTRLNHITSKIPDYKMELKDIPMLIKSMTEDVIREAEGEIVDSPEVRKAIASETSRLVKTLVKGT